MPLFEIAQEELVPFRQLRGTSDLYESEIERLMWANIEEFTGESLFPIARQPTIRGGGRPDIVAIDESARVVVIEIKRAIERSQLAQCLEYAGWARTTNLDEVAGMYHRGPDSFFTDWQDFTASETPVVINPSPRLVLVARDYQDRTASALDFLVENGLPITVITVSIYEDASGRRFVDVEGDTEYEPPIPGDGTAKPKTSRRAYSKINGRRITIADLLEHGLLQAGEELVWRRPQIGTEYRVTITEDGYLELDDGTRSASPSLAAIRASGAAAVDGWMAWRVPSHGGVLLNEVRKELGTRAHEPDAHVAE